MKFFYWDYVFIFSSTYISHPASRASFHFPAAEIWEEKEALHKSCDFFEVTAAPKFGLVSPDQTGFCCAGINFLEKPTIKKEPTIRSRKH